MNSSDGNFSSSIQFACSELTRLLDSGVQVRDNNNNRSIAITPGLRRGNNNNNSSSSSAIVFIFLGHLFNDSAGGHEFPPDVLQWMQSNCFGTAGQSRGYLYYVQLVGEIVIAILSIVTNSTVLVAIATYPSLQTITNYFVASLSTADLFVGLIGIPCVIAAMHQLPGEFSGCLTVNTMIVILTQISIFSLLVIAVERFYAIKYPFDYSRVCTAKRAGMVIALTWVLSVLVTLLPSFAWNLDKKPKFKGECNFTDVFDLRYMVFFNFFGCVLSPLVIMISIYCYIFSVVVRQMRSIEASQLRPSAVGKNRAPSSVGPESGVEPGGRGARPKVSTYDVDAFKRLEEETEEEEEEEEEKEKEEEEEEERKDKAKVEKENVGDGNSGEGGTKKKKKRTKGSLEVVLDVGHLERNGKAAWSAEKNSHGKKRSDKRVSFAEETPEVKDKKSTARKGAGSRWTKDIKAAKWFAVVLLCFIVSWMPLHVLNCLTVLKGILNFDLLTFAILLSHLNSAFNPVLYALGNKKFIAAVRKLLRLKSDQVRPEDTTEH